MKPRPVVIRSADLLVAGIDDRALRRSCARGDLVRVRPGAYLPAEVWRGMKRRDQVVTRVHASASVLTGPVVVSHWSAAAVWGFPVPDAWPEAVEIIDPRCGSSTVRRTLRRRPGAFAAGDVVTWEGLRVTSAARTAADLALSGPFDESVMVLDHGLHEKLFTREHVATQLARRPPAHRSRSALSALRFADGDAEYAGESFSRCGMLSRGMLMPTLQEPFFDSRGRIGRADFWWEALGIVGEFDGDWKYTDERWLRGRTAADAIIDEKRRQARLEAHPRVRRVVRWDYAVARNPDELARRLLAAGVPRLSNGTGRARRHA